MLRRLALVRIEANFLPSSPILVTLMMEELSSFETPFLITVTRRNIPEYGILHSHRRENLKSYIAWTLWLRRNLSPVRYERGFYISEDGIPLSHRREHLKSYIA
jgi:hypothetical protein